MSNYLVLIGDLEQSQAVKEKEREQLQEKLASVLELLNSEAENGLVSPYTITLGDEFQAVFDNADIVFTHILKIMAAVHPVGVRFSLAVGRIDTSINTEQAIGMDGPAFHKARKEIEQLKESGYLINISFTDRNTSTLKIINNSLALVSGQIKSWNKRRLVILHMIQEGYDYKEISEALEISKPAFYKNKDAGMLEVIQKLCSNISDVINKNLRE